MQIMPIDLTAVIAVVMGISTVLIPVVGFTARFALKPLVEALSGFVDRRRVEENVQLLERRMDLVQQQMETLHDSVQRLVEVTEFHHELGKRPRGGDATLPPGPPPGP